MKNQLIQLLLPLTAQQKLKLFQIFTKKCNYHFQAEPVFTCVFADVQLCVCVCAFVSVCARIQMGSRKAHLGFYCKFLVGRQTQPILIALGSLQWLFQRTSPDTAPLNLSSVKINCTGPPAFTWCSLRAPRGRLNQARCFESTLLCVPAFSLMSYNNACIFSWIKRPLNEAHPKKRKPPSTQVSDRC